MDAKSRCQRPVERGLANGLAHGTFADLLQGLARIANGKQELDRIGLDVLNRGFDLHQVRIGGQHGRIVGDAALLRDVDDDPAFDGPGQMPVVAWAGGL